MQQKSNVVRFYDTDPDQVVLSYSVFLVDTNSNDNIVCQAESSFEVPGIENNRSSYTFISLFLRTNLN